MIDIRAEKTINLVTAAAMVPPARVGRKTHISTIWRWIVNGIKGPNGEIVRLDGTRLGSRWITSEEAIQRFTDRLTPHLDVERDDNGEDRRLMK